MNMIAMQIANGTANVAADSGIELGAVIAVVCSWQRNRSILWSHSRGPLVLATRDLLRRHATARRA